MAESASNATSPIASSPVGARDDHLEDRIERDPMALTVEALLGDSVDSFAWRMNALQNSQNVLEGQLDILEQRLERYKQDSTPVPIADAIAKIAVVKKRLSSINHALSKIEKRLQKSLSLVDRH